MEWRNFIRPAVTLVIVIALTEASLCSPDDDARAMANRCGADMHDWTAAPSPRTVRHP